MKERKIMLDRLNLYRWLTYDSCTNKEERLNNYLAALDYLDNFEILYKFLNTLPIKKDTMKVIDGFKSQSTYGKSNNFSEITVSFDNNNSKNIQIVDDKNKKYILVIGLSNE